MLALKHIVADKAGDLQLSGADEDEADSAVAAHGFNQGVNRAAVFQVTAQTDGQIIQPAHFPGNGQQVRQGLGGVVVTAVSGVDYGDGGSLRGHERSALFRMPHGDDVSVAAENLGGVGYAFALGSGGRAGFTEANDAAAQFQHGRLKAQPGAGGRLEEQSGQLFVGTLVLVGFGVGNDILCSSDEPIQFFYAQFQDAVQASHAFAPFWARYLRIRATFSALAGSSSRYSTMSSTSTTE